MVLYYLGIFTTPFAASLISSGQIFRCFFGLFRPCNRETVTLTVGEASINVRRDTSLRDVGR